MFGLLGKKTEKEKLNIQYKKLLKEAYALSKTDRVASDEKAVEANAVLEQIEALNQQNS